MASKEEGQNPAPQQEADTRTQKAPGQPNAARTLYLTGPTPGRGEAQIGALEFRIGGHAVVVPLNEAYEAESAAQFKALQDAALPKGYAWGAAPEQK